MRLELFPGNHYLLLLISFEQRRELLEGDSLVGFRGIRE